MEYKDFFKRYLEETYNSFSKINTMVTNDNKRLLKEIYLPLTLSDDQYFRGGHEILVNGLPDEFNKKGKKVLIVDRAGMGKSTLTKRIFLDVYEKQTLLPVYVELRRIQENQPLTYQIASMMGIKQEDIRKMIDEFQKGYTIFFFDGFDEMQLDIREKVRSKMQDFISQMSNNLFIMTSRPEDSFDDFVGFEKYFIRPLKLQESYLLLRKHDTDNKIAELLIENLKLKQNKAIEEYLTTPLLVSLLYAAYNYKKTIPLKKHLFYEQVYNAYFEKHDSTKDDGFIHQKRSNLDSYEFERILRILGFMCMKMQRVELTEEQMVKMIDSAKAYCPDLHFEPSDYIDDILHSVPLFCKDGLYLRWVHRSLQEYFTAKFIYMDSKTEQDSLLQAMTKSNRVQLYYNIFDIYFDIDNYGFLKNVVLPLLEEYVDFYKNMYQKVPGIKKEYIDERIGLMFLRTCAIGHVEDKHGTSDVFKEIRDACRDNGFSYKSLHRFMGNSGMSLYTAIMPDVRLNIVMLMKDRMPELFSPLDYYPVTQNSRFIDGIEFVKITDVRDFSDNEDSYRLCNYCLMHGGQYRPLVMNFESVSEWIVKIKDMIKAKEDGVFFLQGV